MAIYRVPVEFTYQSGGPPGVNVFHVRTEEAWAVSTSQLQGAVDAIHQLYVTLMGTGLTNDTLFAPGTIPQLGQVVELATQEIVTPAWTDIPASSAEASLSPALAICVSWKTTLAARRGRGRTFFGPLSTYTADPDGTPSTLYLDHVTNACQTLIDTSTAANGWAVGVYGLQNSLDWPLAPGVKASDFPHVLRDITAVTRTNKYAVMRSRRD